MCLLLIKSLLFPRFFFFFTHMPPKKGAGASQPQQPPLKMIKIGTDTQEFGGDPAAEDKYRLAEESSYSPFPNNEVRYFTI